MTETVASEVEIVLDEVLGLASWWGVDEGWTFETLTSATRRVGLATARTYMLARLTRAGEYDVDLHDLHVQVLPGRPMPSAWKTAAWGRDYRAHLDALEREEERERDRCRYDEHEKKPTTTSTPKENPS
jgi:hypothetical protein